MSPSEGKHTITVVSACMTAAGLPDFALNEVAVAPEEAENGIHYYRAEAQLLQDGYQEPFVHFDSTEGPAFLHPAVREYLGLPPAISEVATTALSEER